MAFLILVSLLVPALSAAMEWRVQGVNLKWLSERNWKQVLLGAGASVAVHWAGHVLYLESQGKNWHMQGALEEHCEDPMTDTEWQWFGRSGFVAQVGTALVLSVLTKDSDFTRGFCAVAAWETTTYPVFWSMEELPGDFALIERGGGNGWAEWAVYTAAAWASLGLTLKEREPNDRL